MKIPVIIRMVVVLPAPLRPSRPVIVPFWMEKETPSTARTAPNVFTISRTDRTSLIRPLRYLERGVLYASPRPKLGLDWAYERHIGRMQDPDDLLHDTREGALDR